LLIRPPASETIDSARVETLFAPLADARGLLLAVSGGPDSTALLIMAAAWAARARRPKIAVATVDHGLRASASAEANAVGEHARRRGFDHRVLEWRGEKPKSRIQERARDARYLLLAEHARMIGADHIVTAHHADDQTETVLFRLFRGSAVAGLRGMDMFVARDGLVLARPLLSLRKSDLVAYCQENGETFVHDPSNEDPRFARTRLREFSDLMAEQGFGAQQVERLSRRAARMEEAVARATAQAAERLNWNADAPNRDAVALFAEPQEIVLRLLRQEITRIGGPEAEGIRLEQVEAVGEALRAAALRGQAHGVTLGGARLRLTGKGVLKIDKAPARRDKFGKTQSALAGHRNFAQVLHDKFR
jgi:tRNA(Ile)-lysidine synthase